MSDSLQNLARACATRRDENRVFGIGIYFGAGQHYRHASDVPVFVVMTPTYIKRYQGMK